MSIDINDARKYFKQKEEEQAAQEAKQPLVHGMLRQVEIAHETGDPHLDKLLRVIASKMEEISALSQQFANEAMHTVNADKQKQKQMEFMATQGALKVLMEIAQVPAQIIAEAKGLIS